MGNLTLVQLIIADIIILSVFFTIISLFCGKRASKTNKSKFQKMLNEAQQLNNANKDIINDLIIMPVTPKVVEVFVQTLIKQNVYQI